MKRSLPCEYELVEKEILSGSGGCSGLKFKADNDPAHPRARRVEGRLGGGTICCRPPGLRLLRYEIFGSLFAS